MRVHIGPKYGIHACEVAVALLPELGENIGIDPQVNRLFPLRHHQLCLCPVGIGCCIGMTAIDCSSPFSPSERIRDQSVSPFRR
jgi:hypothetical protein